MTLYELLKIAPSPIGKTDSELAQAYRNWYAERARNMPQDDPVPSAPQLDPEDTKYRMKEPK